MKTTFSKNFSRKKEVEELISTWPQTEWFPLQTSGSSSAIKTVNISKEMLLWSAQSTAKTLGLDKEHVYCCLPFNKTGGFMQVIRAIVHNWDIYFEEPSANPLAEVSLDHNFSMLSVSPHQMHYCLKNSRAQLSRFTTILIGGAPLQSQLEDDLLALIAEYPSMNCWVTYGMTETASHIGIRKLGTDYYTPLDGVELSVASGCLTITIKALNFSIHTTDMAELSSAGFKILGRTDDIINSGGIKLHAIAIESRIALILKDAGIERKIHISSQEDPLLGEALVLMIEGPKIKDVDFIADLLRRELPRYWAPKKIEFYRQLPVGDTGKLKRRPTN